MNPTNEWLEEEIGRLWNSIEILDGIDYGRAGCLRSAVAAYSELLARRKADEGAIVQRHTLADDGRGYSYLTVMFAPGEFGKLGEYVTVTIRKEGA